MKKISITTILLLSFFQHLLAQCTFSDGFENANLPIWSTGPSITSYGTTSSAAVGNYCLLAEGGNSVHLSGLNATVPSGQPSQISWYMKPTGNQASNYVVMGNSFVTANNCVFFCYWFGSGSQIRFVSGNTYTYSATTDT